MGQASNIAPGSLIARRYEVQSLLGRGGMGAVYKALDRLLAETVALKVLDADVASEEMALRFRDEIRLARRVSHRNVCRIHEYGEEEGLRYISMAFVDGVDLKHALREQGPLPPAEAYSVAMSVAAGLQAIHDEGIIHRDLKTSNIMRSRTGVVHLMDFGIAKDGLSSTAAGLTSTGSIMGTPEYMSPEQAMGRRVDMRSDLYAFGIVVYELFTGAVPFHAETPIAVLLQQIQEPLRLDVDEAAAVPPALKPVLARSLAKEPADRFASALEMGEAIGRASQAKGAAERTDVIVLPAVWPPADVRQSSAEVPRRRRTTRSSIAPGTRRWLAGGTLAAAALTVMLVGGGWAWQSVVGLTHTAPPADPISVTNSEAPLGNASPHGPAHMPSSPEPTSGQAEAQSSAPAAPPPSEEPSPAAQLGTGTLRVIAVPWADVTVDGRAVRSQVLRGIHLGPGTHTVSLSHPDYPVVRRSVAIRAGTVTDLVVDLAEEGSRK